MAHGKDMTYRRITRAQIVTIEQLQAETKADLPTSWRGYGKDNAQLLIRQLEAKLKPKPYAEVLKVEQTRLL